MLYCSQILLVALLNAGIYSICPPGEEGKTYNMSGTFIHNLTQQFETAFVKNKTPISKCVFNLTCFDNNNRTITTLKSLNNKEYYFSLTIRSVTRNDLSDWQFKYLGQASLRHKFPLFSCSPQIFAKGENLTCQERRINNVLKVRCSVINVYPEAKGLLLLNVSESALTEISMNCTHELVRRKGVYFTSICDGEVPVTLFKNGDIGDVNVNIYPNITGESDNKRYGLHLTLDTYNNQSVLTLENCPQTVVEGAEVSCLCKTKDTALKTDIKHAWYDAKNNTVNNGDLTLSFIATLGSKEFVCRLIDRVIENNQIYYKPFVIIKADNISCTSRTDRKKFLAVCNVSRILPQGICLFTFNGRKLTNDYSSNEHIKDTNNFYYSTKCTLTVSNGILIQATNTLTVTVYPNITGTNGDEIYGTSKTITFNLSEISESTSLIDHDSHSTFTAQLAPIVLGVTICLFIVIMMALFIFYRKKLGVVKISTPVTIALRTNDRQETSRPCSHLYESVKDINVTSSGELDEIDATYVNSSVLARPPLCSLRCSNNNYITPNDVRSNSQVDHRDDERGLYISLHDDQ